MNNKIDQYIRMINVLEEGFNTEKYSREILLEITSIIKNKIGKLVLQENIYE